MPQLSFEVVYHDEHLLEVLIKATNGRYSGTTIIYLSADGKELIDFGNRLKGFPTDTNQVEEQEFGFTEKEQEKFREMKKIHPNVKVATAHIGLKFYCIDRIGHTAVFVTLQEDKWSERVEAIGKASFEIRFEPARLDKFVQELIDLGKDKEGIATLDGIDDGKDTYI
jgi:hypothetical protein